MVYGNTGSMKCFECGDIGHKWLTCPHRGQEETPANGSTETGGVASEAADWGRPPGELR